MSFILDALKKSETDRQRQASPALFEVKVAAPRFRLRMAETPIRSRPSVCHPWAASCLPISPARVL